MFGWILEAKVISFRVGLEEQFGEIALCEFMYHWSLVRVCYMEVVTVSVLF